MRKVLLLAVVAAFLAGCVADDQGVPPTAETSSTVVDQVTPPTGATGSTLDDQVTPPTVDTSSIAADLPVVDGSTSTRPLRMFIVCAILEVSCAWQEGFDGSRMVLPVAGTSFEPFDISVPSSGTHGSYVALAEGRADLILTARPPTDDEVQIAKSHGIELEIIPVGFDAFVFLVNATNPVAGLDLDQVRGIFSGAISNWAGVGGDDRPIQPYQRNETSGSQVLMKTLVMEGTPMIDAPNMMLPSMMAPFDAISQDPDGIGYSVYYFATNMLAADQVRLLRIEDAEPNPETIGSGEYPLVTEVSAVLRSGLPADSPARMLRDWLTTDAGRSVIEESGYVLSP